MPRLCIALIVLAPSAIAAASEPVAVPETGFEVVAEGRSVVVPEPAILRPSMNFIGFSAFEYAFEPTDDSNGPAWSGHGVALDFGRRITDFIVLAGRYRRTESELDHLSGASETTEDRYSLGLAFAAPFGDSTYLLLEAGLEEERFDLETLSPATPISPATVSPSTLTVTAAEESQGIYGAIELRTMLGRSFELDLRSSAHLLFSTRRLVHSAGFRFYVSPRVAVGAHYEVWERDLRETTRAALDVRIDF